MLPSEERFNLVQQIRRAALSVKLNLAEGCSRRSEAERKRYFEVSRGQSLKLMLPGNCCRLELFNNN
jgi:four helix bundle protein